ncbi:type I restriction-modification system subunit M N-terminal domain-containing protein [Microcoleus sp. MON2_D5]|uniref:type I restriction-modification system subunit M N-terminal domain-containing protein n=1 Tax=Microcoleus sp. MON2_D5 TaxID=2818833 RepID=UPI002FD54E92
MGFCSRLGNSAINAQTKESLEQKLWKAANKLRKNIDAVEYKHIVLGLVFLKYISDSFEQLRYQIVAEKHSGRLKCVSEPSKGTEFLIELPVLQKVLAAQLECL